MLLDSIDIHVLGIDSIAVCDNVQHTNLPNWQPKFVKKIKRVAGFFFVFLISSGIVYENRVGAMV